MVVSTFLVTWLGSFHKIHLDSVSFFGISWHFLTTYLPLFAILLWRLLVTQRVQRVQFYHLIRFNIHTTLVIPGLNITQLLLVINLLAIYLPTPKCRHNLRKKKNPDKAVSSSLRENVHA